VTTQTALDQKTCPVIVDRILIRHMSREDLRPLEWDGEYAHFRRQFQSVYRDYENGVAIPWVAVLPGSGEMLGQVFVLLESRFRPELANGQMRAYLFSIRVKHPYRSQGVGGRLMDVAEDDLRARGYNTATLNVARDNPDAHRFYVRRGYLVVAPEPGQWSYIDHRGRRQYVDEPAWRMEKAL
jgi:ribosomal protein S18 acetylase RimI-like enzyme